MTFLDEQLDKVYVSENFEKSFSKIKSKSGAIIKSMTEGNLFQLRKILNTFPDVSLDELMQVAHKGKNFHRYHLEAKRKIKGDQTEMQKVFILTYGALKGIQNSTKDKTLITKIDDVLIHLNDIITKYGPRFTSEGFTLTLLMMLISFFFGNIPIVGALAVRAGMVGVLMLWFGLLLMVIRIILNTYFSLKGIK